MILNGDLMDLEQASRHLAVSKGAIKIWEARGYLARVNKGESPALYLRTALDDCEQKRHENRKYRRKHRHHEQQV
jgi:hypothetical protein